jgi:ubiquinone/menaquinone biosynthesis C-methylase UbiE
MTKKTRSEQAPSYFEQQAKTYALYRPIYPKEVYAWLASMTEQHTLAVDIGTGNGQAAVELAQYYDNVIGIDGSKAQIEHAVKHPKVTYKVSLADNTGLKDASVDLIAMAQSLHWFGTDLFYQEVRRIAKPNAFIAAWGYSDARISPTINLIFEKFHQTVIGPFWPEERHLVEDKLRTINFPFHDVVVPPFDLVVLMDRQQFVNYIGTWSCTVRYIEAKGVDPMPELDMLLKPLWPDGSKKPVTWSLFFRAAYIR